MTRVRQTCFTRITHVSRGGLLFVHTPPSYLSTYLLAARCLCSDADLVSLWCVSLPSDTAELLSSSWASSSSSVFQRCPSKEPRESLKQDREDNLHTQIQTPRSLCTEEPNTDTEPETLSVPRKAAFHTSTNNMVV